MPEHKRSSRISGFYKLDPEERRRRLSEVTGIPEQELEVLVPGAAIDRLGQFAENVVGQLNLPLGIATNFLIDGREVLVPMAVEETSVVAAASNAARIARAGGGFHTEIVEDLVIGQIELLGVADPGAARSAIEQDRDAIVGEANQAQPSLEPFGGGCRDLEVRTLPDEGDGGHVVVHLLVDCVDAMGANSVNAMCERVAPRLAELSGGRQGLRILSNLADRRRVRAMVRIPTSSLSHDGRSGEEVRELVISASRFAARDPYRAATHNKGIMNGVDAVLIATGNDWRAMEAGAHAFAARSGRYSSMSTWEAGKPDMLIGTLDLPFQLGTVGGVTRLHPSASTSLRILGVDSARELARVVAAAGLAQNFAALRALATEGINRGHMRLHQKNVELLQEHASRGPRTVH